MNNTLLQERNGWYKYALPVLMLFSLFVTLLPFLIHSATPLGYDTGFYRRYLINPVVSFPNTAVPGLDHTIILPRMLLDIVRTIGLNPDITLYGTYIALMLLLVWSFYRFVRLHTNEATALLASLLLITAPVFYEAYWFMFFKNILALSFFFWALSSFKKERWWLAFLFSIAIPLSHQGTTIIYFAILGAYIFIKACKKEKILHELLIFAGTLSIYLYLHPNLVSKIIAPPVGVFLTRIDFLILISPILIPIIFNFKKIWAVIHSQTLLITTLLVLMAFPLLSLPYYPRTFLLLGILLCIPAAIGIQFMIKDKESRFHKTTIAIIALVLVAHTSLLTWKIVTLRPLISEEEQHMLISIKQNVPKGTAILTPSHMTPWIQGWSQARVYSPGVLKDAHTPSEWSLYWSHQDSSYDALFLASFPSPLYIIVDERDSHSFLPEPRCITPLSEMIYRYDCANEVPNYQ